MSPTDPNARMLRHPAAAEAYTALSKKNPLNLKFDSLRSNLRFQELLKKVGFPAV